ncbi:MAG: tRNA (guanosine(37)-N1)-methyltransferase TrmD [Candidatus Shapirobacteria bacterium]
MKIDVITLFPKMFESPFEESMVKRAINKNIIEMEFHDMRKWAWNSYGSVDDRPYGGGPGMLIRVDVIAKALENFKFQISNFKTSRIILTSARGKRFDQAKAEEWSKIDNLIFICGHYEGFDQRISDNLVDEEISIGDYVLTGGELPTMVMIDATVRLVKGVLGKDESSIVESFSEIEIDGKKVRAPEYPQYTRPEIYLEKEVPKVLLSGDLKKIKEWQLEQCRGNNNNSK